MKWCLSYLPARGSDRGSAGEIGGAAGDEPPDAAVIRGTLEWSTARSCASGYSGSVSPVPPSSTGKSLSLGSPSFIGSTVDS